MKEKTVGQIYLEAQATPDNEIDVAELTQKYFKEYEENLVKTIENGKKLYPDEPYFFIEDITKRERLMAKLIRHLILPRATCPTPNYDQTVFRYCKADDALEYIWTIPAPEVCREYIDSMLLLGPEDKELLQFILDFRDGKLELLARKLNNEEFQTNITLIKES